MGGDYIAIDEAAARSGLHKNTIQRLLRQGKLQGFKDHHSGRYRWLVSVRSLDSYTNPWNGFLLDRPGPKPYLRRQEEQDKKEDAGPKGLKDP